MTKIKRVKHVINEEQGGQTVKVNRVEYDFGADVSDDAKDAVRNHVPKLTDKDDIRRVIESVDG